MYSDTQKPGISTHTIRLVIGLIAITLPFLTSWLAGDPPLKSISASYYVTSSDWPRNIFVGFLISISALFLAYNGTNKTEFYLSKVGSVASFLIATFPEQGDAEKPRLILFIDEAHLVFEEASKALLSQIEQICKLIRSKGVGIYFVTQNPADIPEAVLGQLGLKIQHALRAFTAKDRKSIKLAAQNYPDTEFYEVEDLITGMGIGEALVTGLNEKGIPTPLVHCYLRAPQSRMGVLTDTELNHLIAASKLAKKYNEEIDSESAYELLTAKIEDAAAKTEEAATVEADEPKIEKSSQKVEPSMIEKLSKNTAVKQIGRTAARELTRGLLGVLGVKTTRRRSTRKSSWF